MLTGNPSITALNQQIAPPFEEDTPYLKDQMVNYNGIFYVFDEDFAGGTFDEALPHMHNSSVATQIELMPDKIIQEVSGKHYSRTFVQLEDPTLNPDNDVRYGDYWLCTEEGMKWLQVKQFSWQAIKNKTWSNLKGINELYCWDGEKWIRVSEHAAVADAFTRITQTKDMILQEAERAQGAFIAKTSQLQTADQIVQKAEQYTEGRLINYSTIEQTATEIALYVADNAYGKISGIDITSDGVTITGNKYISLESSGYVKIGNWRFDGNGATMYSDTTPKIQFAQWSDKLNATEVGLFADYGSTIQSIHFYNKANGYNNEIVFENDEGGNLIFRNNTTGLPNYGYLGTSNHRWQNLYCIWGNFSQTVTVTGAVTAQDFIRSSSRDIKHDITPLGPMGDIIDALRPVTFVYDSDVEEKTRYGLIYEEAIDIIPDICTDDETHKGISYGTLVPVLLKEIQSLRVRVADLERR